MDNIRISPIDQNHSTSTLTDCLSFTHTTFDSTYTKVQLSKLQVWREQHFETLVLICRVYNNLRTSGYNLLWTNVVYCVTLNEPQPGATVNTKITTKSVGSKRKTCSFGSTQSGALD